MSLISGCDVLFFQAEDGIRDLVRSRGLGDVYKRQDHILAAVGDLQVAIGVDGADVAGRKPAVDQGRFPLSLIHI